LGYRHIRPSGPEAIVDTATLIQTGSEISMTDNNENRK
jgi:hypothetical protein